jgi:hypothetical protein
MGRAAISMRSQLTSGGPFGFTYANKTNLSGECSRAKMATLVNIDYIKYFEIWRWKFVPRLIFLTRIKILL